MPKADTDKPGTVENEPILTRLDQKGRHRERSHRKGAKGVKHRRLSLKRARKGKRVQGASRKGHPPCPALLAVFILHASTRPCIDSYKHERVLALRFPFQVSMRVFLAPNSGRNLAVQKAIDYRCKASILNANYETNVTVGISSRLSSPAGVPFCSCPPRSPYRSHK